MRKRIGVLIDYENQTTHNDFVEEDASYEDIYVAMLHLTALMKGRGEDVVSLIYNILDDLEGGEIVIEEEPPRYLN